MNIISIIALNLVAIFSFHLNATENICFLEDFEKDMTQWELPDNLTSASFIDKSRSTGGNMSLLLPVMKCFRSKKIKIDQASRYELVLDSFSEAYGKFSIKIEEYDAKDNPLTIKQVNQTRDGMWEAGRKKRNFWYKMDIPFDTSANCDHIRILIHKWSKRKVWIDNIVIFKLTSRNILKAEPLSPGNPSKFNSRSLALPGPDGLLYPNWTWAGAHYNKNKKLTIFNINTLGAIPDDGQDDTTAIEKACAEAARNGGGIVQFGKGTYRLTRKIMISSDNIIIRGVGKDKTRLEFGLPDSEVIILPIGNLNIRKCSKIEIFFRAKGAEKVILSYKGKVIEEFANPRIFTALPDAMDFKKIVISGNKILRTTGSGRHFIKAEVLYKRGAIKSSEALIASSIDAHYGGPYSHSVISFIGRKYSKPFLIKNELRRGDRVINLASALDIKQGDYIIITAKKTKRWNKLVHNICTAWGTFRQFVVQVEKVNKNTITLMQPLRIDYPLVDRPDVRKFNPLNSCAIEDMTISQIGEIQKELKMGTVIFSSAINCRAKNLVVDRPGTQAVFGSLVKFCEIRNCIFKNPWRTKTGGLAYTGWERAWDCLIENVETFRMRHAPLLNWTSSGNVIRDSVFHESDAQWHSGWCRDNLYEQCTIESTTRKYKGYGYGFFSTPVDDSMHGPNGPRNVVYNCRSISLKDGIYLGGMNQQWMIMYNNFVIDKGAGIISRFGCRDNIIKGNVFILKTTGFPMMYYEFLDNTGDRLINNTVYGGNGKLFAGPGKPGVVKNNQVYPLNNEAKVSPQPPVPSIYKWQLEKYGEKSTIR